MDTPRNKYELVKWAKSINLKDASIMSKSQLYWYWYNIKLIKNDGTIITKKEN